MTLFHRPGTFRVALVAGEASGDRLEFSYRLSPRTAMSVMAGISAFRSTSFGAVDFDPILADLIGQPTILNLQKVSVASGAGSAFITHTRGPFGFSAGYDRGITPGNGILYASRRDSVFGSASYRPINRVGTNLYTSYGRLHSLQQAGAKNLIHFGRRQH